jgi:hypothetical protein
MFGTGGVLLEEEGARVKTANEGYRSHLAWQKGAPVTNVV